MRPLLDRGVVKGLAHITGGGITENLPRTLPDGCAAEIDRRSWSPPPLFELLQRHGSIAEDEMFRAFNMGVGLVIACAEAEVKRAIELLLDVGEPNAFRIGSVVPGDRTVSYVGAP